MSSWKAKRNWGAGLEAVRLPIGIETADDLIRDRYQTLGVQE
jgi:O-acetylhomoserine/O-acetylserine sulfhydrylase-like pyridoxal-dependent enzyme